MANNKRTQNILGARRVDAKVSMASRTWMSFKALLVLLTGFLGHSLEEGKLMIQSSLRLLGKPVRGAAPWPGWARVPKLLPDPTVS